MDDPSPLTRIALWWVRIACYLALLMPLVTLPGVIYPHVFGKSLFLYSVLILSLPAYAILLLDTRYRPPVTPILQGLVILFAVTLLATLFAHDPALSFWSYPARMTGLWSLLHFGLFFLLLSVFRDPGEWRRLVLFSISISLVVASITLKEKSGLPLDPGAWDERSGSVLGNPAFLSAYLLFNLFFALWRLDEARRWTGRAAFLLIMTLQLGALAQAATRGALVALILGLLLYGLLRLAPAGPAGKRWPLLLGALAVLAALAIWWLGVEWLQGIPGLKRLAGTSLEDGSVQGRLITWGIAWRGFWDHPFLGWGPENFLYLFNQHFDPRLLAAGLDANWFDRAHNQPLETLATAGLAGLAGYLLFLALVLRHLLHLRRAGAISHPLFSAAAALLLAYLVQSLFLFDHPTSLMMFVFCLAWWNALGAVTRTPAGDQAATPPRPEPIGVAGLQPWTLAGLVGFAGFLYWHTLILPPAQASRLVGEGVKSPDPVAATAAFAAALAIPQQYPGMVAYYYAQTALRHAGRARALTSKEIDMLEGADTALRHAVARAAGNSRDHFLLAQLQTQLAKANPAHFTQALAAIDRALALAPRRQELYHLKGRIQLLQGHPALALVTLRAALELEPRVSASWKALALAQYQAGLTTEAVASLRVANSLMVQAGHPEFFPIQK